MQRQEHYRMKRGNTEVTKHTNRTHTQNIRGTDLQTYLINITKNQKP